MSLPASLTGVEPVAVRPFKVVSDFQPAGDQPAAIAALSEGVNTGQRFQTLLGITGSGKSATIAWTIEQVQRLVEHRGFSEEDARNRIARQVSREDRLAKADFVVDNHGSVEDLGPQIDAAWAWIESKRPDRDG